MVIKRYQPVAVKRAFYRAYATLARHMPWPCVCPSVRLSVTSQYCTKTAKCIDHAHNAMESCVTAPMSQRRHNVTGCCSMLTEEIGCQFQFEKSSATDCCRAWLVANCSTLRAHEEQNSAAWLMSTLRADGRIRSMQTATVDDLERPPLGRRARYRLGCR